MKNKASNNIGVLSLEPRIRKPSPASLYLKGSLHLAAAIMAMILLISGAAIYLSQPVLVIYSQDSGEQHLVVPVHADDRLEYHWIHSFEHIPWNERYIIQKDLTLRLTRIEVAGFGAGIPENKGKTEVRNGMVIMSELNEAFDNISWIHSNTALSSISLNNHIIAAGSDLPHHQPVRLEIIRRLNAWLRNH